MQHEHGIIPNLYTFHHLICVQLCIVFTLCMNVGEALIISKYTNVLLLLFAFQSMFISIWVSRLEIAEFPDSVRRSAP